MSVSQGKIPEQSFNSFNQLFPGIFSILCFPSILCSIIILDVIGHLICANMKVDYLWNGTEDTGKIKTKKLSNKLHVVFVFRLGNFSSNTESF